jgi:methylthioribose-1-phosphate isomerase
MKVDGIPYRTIWLDESSGRVEIIDQTLLPHRFEIRALATLDEVAEAIVTMRVRGAPLIGATAAYGLALALQSDASVASEERACEVLLATRPTAVNLRWALERMQKRLVGVAPADRAQRALEEAAAICDEDAATCERIGLSGLPLLEHAWENKKDSGLPLNLLTHCNAGWLATVDWGTALAPVYRVHRSGMPVHVWVSETRPRNQGASLTAWELAEEGVPHTVIPDNASGHLLRTGRVDLVITGTDRTTATGDVCNKIGTYMKAVAARDCGVPFYAAIPGPSIDWELGEEGIDEIPIEERDHLEVTEVVGMGPDGRVTSVRITPTGSPVANFGFDVTPARLVTGIITERGVCDASRDGLLSLYPERAPAEGPRE